LKNIVLLHGALGDEIQVSALKQRLKSRYNCFTFTFHGHGKKSKDSRPFTIASFSEELKEFILDQRISGCCIFGYSMGGFIATYLAYKNPSLISKVTTYGTQFNWTPEISAKETGRLDPDAILAKVPVFAENLEKIHGQHWKAVLNRTAGLMTDLGANNPLNDTILQSIQTEIRVVRGSQDRMVDSAYSRHVNLLLPNSEFHEIEGAPHPLQHVDLVKLIQYIA
jgi:pimeloyl-ACP methyl ester carboxylesterase